MRERPLSLLPRCAPRTPRRSEGAKREGNRKGRRKERLERGEIGGSKWTSRVGPQLDTGAPAFPQDTRSNRYAARLVSGNVQLFEHPAGMK